MKRILIVEDDISTVEMLEMFFSKSNYSVRVLRSGLGVCELAKKYRPDLILLDGVLPGLDGHSVQKKLLEDEETKKIPVIMISAKAQFEQVFVNEENVVGFITKPFSLADLREKVQTAMRKANSL